MARVGVVESVAVVDAAGFGVGVFAAEAGGHEFTGEAGVAGFPSTGVALPNKLGEGDWFGCLSPVGS